VPVDDQLRDAGSRGHVVHGRLGEATAGERARGCFEDGGPPRGPG
jgi:hypothetical protein